MSTNNLDPEVKQGMDDAFLKMQQRLKDKLTPEAMLLITEATSKANNPKGVLEAILLQLYADGAKELLDEITKN
jgi:hypothetical protein